MKLLAGLVGIIAAGPCPSEDCWTVNKESSFCELRSDATCFKAQFKIVWQKLIVEKYHF